MKTNSCIITRDGISVVIDGKPYTATLDHPRYEDIKTAIKAGRYEDVPDLISLIRAVKKYVQHNNDVIIDEIGGTISYRGETIHNTMVGRILNMMREGFSIEPMTLLLANLYNNVSKKAIDELYQFLEFGQMPITEDGHFLAYKRVNKDYTSVFDGTTDNSIGNVVSMPRHQVDDRSEVTCSTGLHICSFSYLKYYPGDRVIVVKVNPSDVVSIPTDYNNTKARVCRYEVINELTPEEAGLNDHSFGTSVYTSPVPEDPAKDEVIQQLEETLLDIALQKEEDEQKPVSDWYMYGYGCGYADGKTKNSIADDCKLGQSGTEGMSQQDVDEVNQAYMVGYKDGRGHKRRQFCKTPFPGKPQ